MTVPLQSWLLALDEAGSADAVVLRRTLEFAAVIALFAVGVIVLGAIPLPPFPQFAILHAGFIFLIDIVTSFVLFGQFRYRRRLSYAILASAYLFSALVVVPFLLAFPGALREGVVIGGKQSSIWIWHCWHIVFPVVVLGAVLVDDHPWNGPLAETRVARIRLLAPMLVAVLVAGIAIAATTFHDSLPVLIDGMRRPLSDNFYLVGSTAAMVTALAFAAAWRLGWQKRSILHLWLAVSLTAVLADVAASIAAHARYSVGWYFGRIESMIAASVLLMVFLGEINRLYRNLGATMTVLSRANEGLVKAVEEKDALVAELRRSDEQVRQLAFYDPLTDLPNRRLLLDRIAQALAKAKRHHGSMAIMFIDLDHFKQVNDTLGHDAGDRLLKEVAGRLSACVRDEDTVARSGGDEFVVVLSEVSEPRDAALVAAKMAQAVGEPVAIGEHGLHVTISIGIAVYPVDGTDDVQALMQKADTAMYAAKEAGRNRVRFYGDVAEAIIMPAREPDACV